MRISKKYLLFLLFACALFSAAINSYAQAPNISYTPSTNVYTINTAITPLIPANSGGPVASFAYGAGVQLTGATLSNPYGMGIDPSGNIYVVNYGNNSVSKYNSAGTYQGTFGTNANLSEPAGITFDASGNGYVLNYHRTNNGLGNNHGNAYVDKYNSAGAYQSTIIQGLGTANGLAQDASNYLYVAQGNYNGGANTVSQYNISGALAFNIATGHTTNPVAVAVDGSYNIYVLDNSGQNVTKYNSTGGYLSTVITGLSNPNAIYVDGAGDIYVGDSGTHTVTVYNGSGTLLTTISGITDPEGLVTDSKGNLYVSDFTSNTVTRYPPVGGYYLSGILPPGLNFSSATGTFSGTPTSPFSATTYTITAYNAIGSGNTTVTLSCPPNLSAPLISYNPSINVFTINSPITALTPSNTGGTPTSYSISPATLPAGLLFSSSTGVITGTPTAQTAATIFTITATNGSGSSSAKVSIACVVDNYWTGSKNNDWATKQNWSANHVPTATDLASIGVVNYAGSEPAILANTTVAAYYVTFGANSGTLTVQNGATLTINNILTINNNATPNFIGQGTGAINIVPAAVVNISGTGALTITNASSTVNLVTLQSNASGSATISQMTSGSISGTVNVQRYVTGGAGYRGYRLISSPVNSGVTANGNTIFSMNYLAAAIPSTGLNGIPGGFTKAGNPTFYLFREDKVPNNSSYVTGNFRAIADMSADPNYTIELDGSGFNLPVGTGILMFFRGSLATVNPFVTTTTPVAATITASGKLNQGAITVADWYNPAPKTLGYTTTSGLASIEGFNLVGNPYASSIDWNTWSSSVSTAGIYAPNTSGFIYMLNPTGQAAGGNYGVYSQSTGGVNNATNIIPSGVGFFVQASGAGTASLTFNESAKISTQVTGANLFMTTQPVAETVRRSILIKLAMDTINTDETLLNFDSGTKTTFDIAEDARYQTGTGKVHLASMSADRVALAINQLPLSRTVNIPLKVSATSNGSYTITAKRITGVPALYDIFLKDAFTKDSINMRTTGSYSFDINTADTSTFGSDRFVLTMTQNPALAYKLIDFTAGKGTGKQVLVQWSTANEENYTRFTVERSTDRGNHFDVIGGLTSTGAGVYAITDNAPVAGPNLYRLVQEDMNNDISYSKTAEVMYSNQAGGMANVLSAYPNPAKSNISLIIQPKTATDTGYEISITSGAGQLVKQAITTQPFWQGEVSGLLPGTYFIRVISKKDKSLVGKTQFIKL
ncbi:putative Ig domain-containing protein [Mucilaginibacter sp.]|jgi:sugar lactone lactonase YvrE|uniref:putative Ig domain-containing protein n=1 Tax=Mucilaginibacter sp. TaxID=1882438 RepID=UPI002C4D3C6F|nr:putative Ig domain-containing protein [Mucilaginibacter sp.]HTI59826.1 putative Ig domain-containing protein [Mucilaginibacter sp.]